MNSNFQLTLECFNNESPFNLEMTLKIANIMCNAYSTIDAVRLLFLYWISHFSLMFTSFLFATWQKPSCCIPYWPQFIVLYGKISKVIRKFERGNKKNKIKVREDAIKWRVNLAPATPHPVLTPYLYKFSVKKELVPTHNKIMPKNAQN